MMMMMMMMMMMGALSPYNVAMAEAYLHVKFYLDPSNRLAIIIHQRYRQTDRTDSGPIAYIGRTVLQKVVQKPGILKIFQNCHFFWILIVLYCVKPVFSH